MGTFSLPLLFGSTAIVKPAINPTHRIKRIGTRDRPATNPRPPAAER